jgi:hypothetical protein
MRAILILTAIIVAGCASVGQKQNTLYDSFERYHKAIADGDIVARRREFFVPAMLETLNVNSENGRFQLKIGQYIHNETSHYEKIELNRGCLTMNGHDEDSNPTSLFLEYRQNDGAWLISSTYIYVQEKQDFSEKALCPDEAQDTLTKKLGIKS